jgi:hypothetical protein
MSVLSTTRRKLAAGGLVAAVTLGGGGAIAAVTGSGAATAAPSASSPAPALALTTASATGPRTSRPGRALPPEAVAARRYDRLRHLLFGTDHATFELKRHGAWVTFSYDRGVVTAASPSAITLRRPDGVTVRLAIRLGETRLRGQVLTSSGVAGIVVGHEARVVSEAGTALRIFQKRS